MKQTYIENLGKRLSTLYDETKRWSEETFGSDDKRGPIGPLKHLEKEARECQEAPYDIEEYADCLLLIIDASRRAGIDLLHLLEGTQQKLNKNKLRTWPTPKDNEPVEHIKGNT